LCERFLEHIKSLEIINRVEIATLQRLKSVHIWKAFANVWKVWTNSLHEDISVFIERILKSVAEFSWNIIHSVW